MEAFLRPRIDTEYGYRVAFEPVTGIVSPAQRERLGNLMVRFIAREAVVIGQVGQDGQVRFDRTRETDAGTEVELTYRDANGEYPMTVLVSRSLVDGRLLIRDVGSPELSSVVSKLRYATQSLAAATPDADIWITAFEQALGE
jgi:hypothetical protein